MRHKRATLYLKENFPSSCWRSDCWLSCYVMSIFNIVMARYWTWINMFKLVSLYHVPRAIFDVFMTVSLWFADRLAQMVEHRTAVWEVAGSNLCRTNTQGLSLPLSSQIRTINRRPRLTVLVWGVKEPTHCSDRTGMMSGWCSPDHSDLGAPMYHTVLSHKNCELRGAVWQSPPQIVVKRIWLYPYRKMRYINIKHFH